MTGESFGEPESGRLAEACCDACDRGPLVSRDVLAMGEVVPQGFPFLDNFCARALALQGEEAQPFGVFQQNLGLV